MAIKFHRILPVYRLLLLTLLLAHFISAAVQPAFASPEKQLEQVLSLPDEKIDLGEMALLISQDRDATLDLPSLRAELDRLTNSVRRKLTPSSSPEEIVNALRTSIHQEGGYRYTDEVDAQGIPVDPAELFVHGMLKSKRGYCMNLSLLYLIIGDRLNLPLHGVPLPNHFFVRYESGNKRINIEATEQGISQPDDFYRQRFGVSADSPQTFFMHNLGKKQTLGAYFSNVGMVYYKGKQIEKAVFYLNLATAINTTSIEAHNNLANIYSELKQTDKAIQHYNLALKADPGNMSTLYNLGLEYKQSGQVEQAIEAFLQAVQIDPFFTPGHQALAQLYLQKRKYFGALLHLQKLARLDPENFKTRITIGEVYLRLGQHQMALDRFNALRAKYPGNPAVLEPLAETFYRMENLDKAIELYRYLIEYNPEHMKAYIQLGWTYYRKGDFGMATGWTKRGLKRGKGPENLTTLAQMNLGFYALLKQSYPEAKQWYLKALANQDASVTEGMVTDIREAAERFPKRSDLEFFTGWIYLQAGQTENARLILEHYLTRNETGGLTEEARTLLQSLNLKKAAASEEIRTPEGMVLIPAGMFTMGSTQTGLDESPEHQVYLDAYFIDIHEVSATEYSEFLNAVDNVKGYYLDNKYGMLFYNGQFQPRPGLESHPINNVNWRGAGAYCRWKEKRLPTEAEWEKAARGKDKRTFPWGNTRPTPELARYFQTWTEETKHNVMVPVNALPEGKSPYGLFNMAGNVKEWVDDWYDGEYYAETTEYTNPEGPVGGEFKVLRGGSWRDLGGFVYSSFRNNSYPDTRMDDYGFRCVKSAGEEPKGTKKLIRWSDPLLHGRSSVSNIGLDR